MGHSRRGAEHGARSKCHPAHWFGLWLPSCSASCKEEGTAKESAGEEVVENVQEQVPYSIVAAEMKRSISVLFNFRFSRASQTQTLFFFSFLLLFNPKHPAVEATHADALHVAMRWHDRELDAARIPAAPPTAGTQGTVMYLCRAAHPQKAAGRQGSSLVAFPAS